MRKSNHPEAEIAELQQRIRLHRALLWLDVRNAQDACRERLASPGMLLASAGTGFLLGRLTRREGPRRPSALGRSWALLTDAVRAGLKFAQSGPVVWLATTLGVARAQGSTQQDVQASGQQ